jgi:signal peptidase I
MFQKNGGFSRYSAYVRGKKQRTRIKRFLIVTAGFFVCLGLLAFLGVSSLSIQGEAMEPNLHNGDRLLSAALPYGLTFVFSEKRYFAAGTPERGDIVLARPGYHSSPPSWFVALDRILGILSFQKINMEFILGAHRGDSLLVRRIVGIPGDTLYMKEGRVFCRPSGQDEFLREDELIDEAYSVKLPQRIPGWESGFPGPSDFPQTILGENEYFLLCDNRGIMDDSRLWGTVPQRAVLGKIVFTYWPLPFL